MQKHIVETECEFCGLTENSEFMVYDDDVAVAVLDFRPVFPGHTLVVPKLHFEAMKDMPEELIGPFFSRVKLISNGVEKAMGADGTFVAINNKVSQSVPHFHVHVIPRKFKDGLHGFFWPRQRYSDKDEQERIKTLIKKAIEDMANNV